MEELSTQLKNIMIATEVLFLLWLIVPILTLGVASQADNSAQVLDFKPEVTEQVHLLFTGETVIMRSNREQGKQFNIRQLMPTYGGSLEDNLIVTNSKLNQSLGGKYRLDGDVNYTYLVTEAGPHINGSVFNYVVTESFSVTSLQIAVEPRPNLMNPNCTSKNECTVVIVTSPHVMINSVSPPCHLGSTWFNGTHAITHVRCQSHMNESCCEFITASFLLTNSKSENARQLSLGPVCRDDDVQDLGKTSTEHTVETTNDAPEKEGMSVTGKIVLAVVGIIVPVVIVSLIVWQYCKKMPGCNEIQSGSNSDNQAGKYSINENINVRTENRAESSELSNRSPDLRH